MFHDIDKIMKKTLIARIGRWEQYDAERKTVLWDAKSEDVWKGVYAQLRPNDNSIFIGEGRLLFGVVTQVKDRKNILCSHIQEVQCSNDHFLQLHKIYPELISRVKANFEPFLHPYNGEIEIENVIHSAKNKDFLSFYILKNFKNYKEVCETGLFKENDRIIILSKNQKIESVLIHSKDKLIDSSFNEKLLVKGMSLNDIKNIFKEAYESKLKKREGEGNNVRLIDSILEAIESKDYFKFVSFNAYHNALFNQKIFAGKSNLITEENFIAPPAPIENINSSIDDGNTMPLNTILYGPPGTGKTYNTAQKAIEVCGKHIEGEGRAAIMAEYKELHKVGRISFITFHQSYGYEEFVEGLRPILQDDKNPVCGQNDQATSTGDVRYEIRQGAFRVLCERARGKDEPYVIIIDEINRGNISKIFGELISLIEEDKRSGGVNELTVTLPYSQEQFSVPKNVYIIGTMNTADRSLALVDTALRRRFHFEEMMPDTQVLDELTINGVDISLMLATMNRRIEALYDREHTIGHAYFTELNGKEKDKQFNMLQNIFQNKIIPLLEEYFFEDWEKIRKVLGDNQKEQTEHQFITSESVKWEALFGEKQDDDFHQADEKKTYAFNDVAFCNPLSYIRIYQPKEL